MTILKVGDKAFSLMNGREMTATPKTVRNAKSRLLCLPSEIKNKIYIEVLGGKTLHCVRVTRQNGRRSVAYTECHLDDIDGCDYQRFISLSTDKDYFEKHTANQCSSRCFTPRSCEPFAILQVCQQIYAETALLPLEENTFSFRNPQVLRRFVHTLQPIQQRAIRRVVVAVAFSTSTDQDWALPLINLTGLSELSYHRRIDGYNRRSDIIDEETIQVLEELPLLKVNMRLSSYFTLSTWGTQEDIEAQTKQTEQRLLRTAATGNAHDGPSAGYYGLAVFGL